jgi:hypothetical protein
MDEQKFIDLMHIQISILEKVQGLKEDKIPPRLTDVIIECGLPFKDSVEVKSSVIHGKGVFATEDIEVGKVVTMYPCHGLLFSSGYCYGSPEFQKGLLSYQSSEYKTHLRDSNQSIIGDSSIHDKYLLGHMINEAYLHTEEFKNITGAMELGKACTKYLLKINEKNCELITTPLYVYVKTTKHICPGEELTTSYGFAFWCKQLNESQIEKLLMTYFLTLAHNQKKFFTKLFYESNTTNYPLHTH